MLPSALTIAGLDPSGGAGIAADLRAFEAAGAWGNAVCAALTVQSTRGVRSVHPIARALVIAQAEEVLADARVCAIKTGALGSAANARSIASLFEAHPQIPTIVDPVMIPSRRVSTGARLDGGVPALRRLIQGATLITPNLAEASALLGEEVASPEEARAAAVALVHAGASAALVKGGHARGDEAIDWLAIRGRTIKTVRIARPRRKTPPLHGTGCTLASLIAGRLAARTSGSPRPPAEAELIAAVRWARSRLDRALSLPLAAGSGLRVLDVNRP